MTERRTVLENRVDLPRAGDPRGPHLPALLGIELVHIDERRVTARLPVRHELIAPTGSLPPGWHA
jgi:acyl-coenzyme A thioesterase PaaI-like protein